MGCEIKFSPNLTQQRKRLISHIPGTESVKVGETAFHFALGADANGHFSKIDTNRFEKAPPAANELEAKAEAGAKFTLLFKLPINFLKVMDFENESGGCGWVFYRQDEALNFPHYLYATLAVPADFTELHFDLEFWVRRRAWWGGRGIGTGTAKYPPKKSSFVTIIP